MRSQTRAKRPAAFDELQRRCNRDTADCWELFAGHRARLTALVLEHASRRVAIVGAGNCNDLDLEALAVRSKEIHLIDIDAEAVQRARSRQPAAVAGALCLHAPVDLSGG